MRMLHHSNSNVYREMFKGQVHRLVLIIVDREHEHRFTVHLHERVDVIEVAGSVSASDNTSVAVVRQCLESFHQDVE